jgi:hypothetical protein
LRIFYRAVTYKISWDSVGRDDVDGSADCAVAPVRREDNDGGDPGLERAMKVGKALPEEKKENSSTGEI